MTPVKFGPMKYGTLADVNWTHITVWFAYWPLFSLSQLPVLTTILWSQLFVVIEIDHNLWAHNIVGLPLSGSLRSCVQGCSSRARVWPSFIQGGVSEVEWSAISRWRSQISSVRLMSLIFLLFQWVALFFLGLAVDMKHIHARISARHWGERGGWGCLADCLVWAMLKMVSLDRGQVKPF